jgi:ribonuclease HII
MQNIIVGVDEAGRGPLAGEVVAAAVVLNDASILSEAKDSKVLSEKKREFLFNKIIEKADGYFIATSSVQEIEQFNILNATKLAMARAVKGLNVDPSIVLVDGNALPKWKYNSKAIVQGDKTESIISCASILAKVYRDNLMKNFDEIYPAYGFAKHKGYGTKSHIAAIKQYGPCPIHRKSFLKKIILGANVA